MKRNRRGATYGIGVLQTCDGMLAADIPAAATSGHRCRYRCRSADSNTQPTGQADSHHSEGNSATTSNDPTAPNAATSAATADDGGSSVIDSELAVVRQTNWQFSISHLLLYFLAFDTRQQKQQQS